MTSTLPEQCASMAARAAKLAADVQEPTVWPATYTPDLQRSAVAHRLAWDAPAAGEFVRPMLHDGLDVALVAPDLAEQTWHHIAGAIIMPSNCGCMPPARHSDELVTIAREIRARRDADLMAVPA